MQKLLSEFAVSANESIQFSQRRRQLTAEGLVQILTLGWLEKPTGSLNAIAHLGRQLGIQVSSQALHERINERGVALMRRVCQQALHELQAACPLALPLLQKFAGIYITDSTQIKLPDALREMFRGNEDDNAMMKLQVTWDYLNGHLAAVEMEEGRSPDQRCKLHVRHALENTLHLFDLGYFKQEYLKAIDEQGAFFVSRYQSQTALYDSQTDERLELHKHLRKCKSDVIELEVKVGQRTRHTMRLVARRLSPKAAAERRRKAKKKAREQGKTCTKAYLELLGWDILLTNLPASEWPILLIFDLYPIRFQIEWVFRIWKDQLGLDKLGNWRIERILVQLYAHLLGAILVFMLTVNHRWHDVEYSLAKCVQIIQSALPALRKVIVRQGWGFKAWLQRLQGDFRTFARKTKRRKSPSTAQIISNWSLT